MCVHREWINFTNREWLTNKPYLLFLIISRSEFKIMSQTLLSQRKRSRNQQSYNLWGLLRIVWKKPKVMLKMCREKKYFICKKTQLYMLVPKWSFPNSNYFWYGNSNILPSKKYGHRILSFCKCFIKQTKWLAKQLNAFCQSYLKETSFSQNQELVEQTLKELALSIWSDLSFHKHLLGHKQKKVFFFQN